MIDSCYELIIVQFLGCSCISCDYAALFEVGVKLVGFWFWIPVLSFNPLGAYCTLVMFKRLDYDHERIYSIVNRSMKSFDLWNLYLMNSDMLWWTDV